jgi:23S rRNA pseudouridine955/2504/2580 synthase
MTIEYVTIGENAEGQRVDNFLIAHIKGVPKSRLYRAIRSGEVRVNKKRVDATYRLVLEDSVRIPPLRQSEKSPVFISSKSTDDIEAAILYEEPGFLVLNKPAGIPVHGGTQHSYGVIDALRKSRGDAAYLELVHRLDKGTSGCLLIAKKRSMLTAIQAQFNTDGLQKIYHCLVYGLVMPAHFFIDKPLKKNILQSGERLVKVDPMGKVAKTEIEVEWSEKNKSFLKVILHTGRTHQIRVHLQSVGYPLIGDDKYGDKIQDKVFFEKNPKRLYLHASQISFIHPLTAKRLSFEAPLPFG